MATSDTVKVVRKTGWLVNEKHGTKYAFVSANFPTLGVKLNDLCVSQSGKDTSQYQVFTGKPDVRGEKKFYPISLSADLRAEIIRQAQL